MQEIELQTDRRMAYALLRLVIGTNVGIHGVSRILNGPTKFAAAMATQFAVTPLPQSIVHLYGLCLPPAETVIGVLVIAGVWTRWALVLGLLAILTLTFGSTLRQDWESAGIQLGYALVYAVLLAQRQYNTYSLDGLRMSKE